MVGRDVLLRVEDRDEPGEPRLAAEDLVVLSNTGARAVDGVGLVVRSGEILGIAGVDGNGQTELADALAGVVTPRAGASTSTARTSRLWGPTPGGSGGSPTCPRIGRARGSCRTSCSTRTTP